MLWFKWWNELIFSLDSEIRIVLNVFDQFQYFYICTLWSLSLKFTAVYLKSVFLAVFNDFFMKLPDWQKDSLGEHLVILFDQLEVVVS